MADQENELGEGLLCNSGYLLVAAERAALAAVADSSQALGAIVLATSSVEALPFEAGLFSAKLDGVSAPPRPDAVRLAALVRSAGFERASSKDRLEFFYLALDRDGPDWGRDPFQSLGDLIDLRNAILHLRPEVIPAAREKAPKVRRGVAALVNKGLIAKEDEGKGGILLSGVSNAKVAKWACIVSREARKHIVANMPNGMAKALLAYWFEVGRGEPIGAISVNRGQQRPFIGRTVGGERNKRTRR